MIVQCTLHNEIHWIYGVIKPQVHQPQKPWRQIKNFIMGLVTFTLFHATNFTDLMMKQVIGINAQYQVHDI